ncbi:MAG: M28 family peptidase [Gemmatimonadota bacterium]
MTTRSLTPPLLFLALAVVFAPAAPAPLPAQEAEDRTLLSQEEMTAIINEVSGERAMHHLLELVPYHRVRPPEEYQGPYRESQVLARFAEDYGFSNVSIEVFQEGGTTWQPTRGELWMTAPVSRKLFDLHDLALSLAALNANGDFVGELVDVGNGRPEDFEAVDVTGRFVLSSGSVRSVYGAAVERGAVGVLALSTIGPARAVDYPNQIVSTSVNARPGTVAWAITPEVHADLSALLQRGETVAIRSINESVEVPSKAEYVHAEIPGDGSTDQEVAIAGHVYEGVIKQGANDDNSGVALTLEIGRAYLKLIREGKLPPPKRTINFQWVPEFSGTYAWLDANPEKEKAIIGTLNFDMEGIRVSDSRSYWVLQRTPDTFPSYLNDIPQSMMEYVADISRERVRFRRGLQGYAPSQPVESPRGSKDAFYIKIDQHYGSSDHVAYMSRGIPAVMFITWPDMWYHSSEDTPDKHDPTQYKRAAAVGLGSLAVLATGTDEIAARVLNENLGRGLARMGESHTKGLGYLADVTTPTELGVAYREARNAIEHQASIEKAVVRSASVMWTDVEAGRKKTAAFEPLIDQRAEVLLNEVWAAYTLQAEQHGVEAVQPQLTPAQREAASLRVDAVEGAGRTRGGPSLPDEFNAELSLLLPRGMTVLEIRDFLSGEFTPLPLDGLMTVLRAREEAGAVRLVAAGG